VPCACNAATVAVELSKPSMSNICTLVFVGTAPCNCQFHVIEAAAVGCQIAPAPAVASRSGTMTATVTSNRQRLFASVLLRAPTASSVALPERAQTE